MSQQYPDRISIEHHDQVDIEPKWVLMEVEIEGESSAFANEAFKRSKEVAKFLADLQSLGYDNQHVILDHISLHAGAGAILKSSMAKFRLKLDKIPLDKMASILSMIAAQKNIDLCDVSYDFGNLAEHKNKLLLESCHTAKQQAQLACKVLAVPLLGVYSMTPKWTYPSGQATSEHYADSGFGMAKFRGSAGRGELDGLDIATNYKGRLILNLKMDFRVGDFTA